MIRSAMNWPLVRDADEGATAVEFAIIFPVFVLFVFGIIQFGLVLWTKFALQHATAEAARCATVNGTLCGTASGVQAYAATQAYGLKFPSSVFNVTTSTCGNQVIADYTFVFIESLGVPNVRLNVSSCFPK
jgi:Flp pilus assembly protein TadG